ncbi:hypothetical protein BaRGS_00026943 [Batillaria attramentaria]|uniref:Uncharacterized protein n=1 Tax=Batillaria attramentaria TaxID=370345 RepID=A0ABD0K4F2_9CAEN
MASTHSEERATGSLITGHRYFVSTADQSVPTLYPCCAHLVSPQHAGISTKEHVRAVIESFVASGITSCRARSTIATRGLPPTPLGEDLFNPFTTSVMVMRYLPRQLACDCCAMPTHP